MNQLLFIETFVLGAAFIAAIYHLVLFIQQRERFLLFYSFYLFSLSFYIFFKLVTNNYDPFQPTDSTLNYIIEEVLQLFMVSVYTTFAAITLEVDKSKGSVRRLWIVFIIVALLSILHHITQAVFFDAKSKSYFDYGVSRFSIITIAIVALILVWQIRTTRFQRIIIVGSFVYAFSGLMSALSFTQDITILGLSGVEPYLLGCLLDIIIFSSAFGYRIKLISEEKKLLLEKQIKSQLELLNERKRISNELHDDLGSGLTTIRFLTEIARAEHKSTETIARLDKIASMSNDLIDNMRQIVWSMNTSENTLENLIFDVKKYAFEYLETNNISLLFNVKAEIPTRILQNEVRRNVFLVVKEALHNIVKHSSATNVIFNISFNSLAQFEIADNGKGFDIDQLSGNGNGLASMKNRISAIKGSFYLNNQSGTVVVFEF